jgi:3-oxoacyl-[acyl-carrier-protein] synthase-3
MTRSAIVVGLGAALPPRIVTNQMLSERLDTTDEWIYSRTGIRERHMVEPGTSTGDLATEAAERALKSAGVSAVDMVVLATTTPDRPCPATAPDVATRLGLVGVPAFDVAAVCSGFVYGLAIGASVISGGLAESVLVIGAEAFTTIIDPDDRTTAAIFGDGAGAVVLRAGESSDPGALLAFDLGSDGGMVDLITVPAGGAQQKVPTGPADQYFQMQGRPTFMNAVQRMEKSTRTVLERVGWAAADVDRLVGHQANVRILHSVADGLGIPRDRAVINLDRVGNTAAASIPLALHDAAAAGTLHTGERVVLTAFGGGATWGSVALTWPDLTV